jgi:hypothetical protein
MDDQFVAEDKRLKLFDDGGEAWMIAEELGGQAVNSAGLGGNVALRVHIFVERSTAGNVVDEFHRPDLDDAVPGAGIESGGFGIKDDLADHVLPSRLS